ncbi:TetR/AcrR family transcriptional regulator C-terminal domain-containing protein [Gordonia sp. ABSL11-1]|uniref:TetR/AcrR family transcriptional regulator n=1 Tax=Gordonia sp. ABSL11-1 TaxID=3053924 RepID=UPI0025745CEC|nr:TetR/AcrR family transcriptional regulator C-terminal domain-containing protein [Gordonia sp. ABSL11-1]MDL9944341.1 TetR/AcrR family transcriptional regulator C-terminal domain-containing protein [Gordonia sp. ABSL11-1]
MPSTDDPDARHLPRYLALLWGRADTGPRRGPRPTLTVHDIGRAAVEIADTDGVDAVSMKAVAGRLGLTTMSLYRYVESKDDVVDVMVDTAFGPADPSLTASGTWRERLTAWALSAAELGRRRPWLATIPLRRPPVGPNVLSWTDAGVRAFEQTRLDGQQKLSALLLVDGFVRQHVRQASQMGMLDISDADAAASYETTVAALVGDGHLPNLAAAISDPAMADSDDYFTEELDFGLTVILDGISALVDRTGG